MPASTAYAERETAELGVGQSKKIAAQTNEAIQVEVTQGTVRFEATRGGISPTGCGNRCRVQLLSDSLNATELSGFTLAGGHGNAAIHAINKPTNQPVKIDAELTAGEFIEYSGPLDVTITGTSAGSASVSIKTSGTELVDPA